MRRSAFLIAALAASSTSLAAQAPLSHLLLPISSWRTVNRGPQAVDDHGRVILRFPEGPDVGLTWDPSFDLSDGDIEFDTRGRDVAQKSFVGIAFRIRNDTTWDAVYLRPFNFRAADSAQHAHAIQYIANPGFGWKELRATHPGQYESAIVPEPAANEWVHVRVELRGPWVRVFINEMKRPVLDVRTLSGLAHGGVGLWVGDASDGDFANLHVRASP